MGFEDEVEQSLQRPCRQIKRQVQADMRTHLIHRPARDIIHRSVELEFPSIGFDPVEFSCCCRGLSPGPTELGAVHPDAVHDHGQPTRQRHDRLFHPATVHGLGLAFERDYCRTNFVGSVNFERIDGEPEVAGRSLNISGFTKRCRIGGIGQHRQPSESRGSSEPEARSVFRSYQSTEATVR